MTEGVEALIDELVRKHPQATSRRLTTSRLIVGECIKTLDALGGATTIADLLGAAAASSRRLRQAFSDTFDVPPVRYLQLRILNRAQQRLSTGGDCYTVTKVASDLGVTHMGRFARRYHEVFEEFPSETLEKAG